jgi:hypothetical protein
VDVLQVYVQTQSSETDRAEAHAAFAHHCGTTARLSASSAGPDSRLSLVRPCAWPHPLRLSSLLEDSAAAALALEASLLEGYAAELAARQALQAVEGGLPCTSATHAQRLFQLHAD